MMYPPPTKVRYEELPMVFGNVRLLALSLVQNWIVGPLLMSTCSSPFCGHSSAWRAPSSRVPFWSIGRTVLVYLGIPSAGGLLTRLVLSRACDKDWYDDRFVPRISRITPVALLFTVFIMFSLKGDVIVEFARQVIRVAIPYAVDFAAMFFVTFPAARKLAAGYRRRPRPRSRRPATTSSWSSRWQSPYSVWTPPSHLPRSSARWSKYRC